MELSSGHKTFFGYSQEKYQRSQTTVAELERKYSEYEMILEARETIEDRKKVCLYGVQAV